jgi:hypothetical protein
MTALGGASKGNPFYEVLGVGRYWRYSEAKMKVLIEKGMVVQTRKGAVPRRKLYLDEGKGVSLQTIWDDVSALSSKSSERIGYPTQKPEALLERIIKMASNEGDTVLDCFLGGGTTIAVADKLNRNWIGIDQSVQAVKVTEFRLNAQQGKLIGQTGSMFAKPFTVQLYKYDYDTLRYKNALEFENWIVGQFGGLPNTKQKGDLGIDGKKDSTPIQVKRSDNVGRNVIDNFKSAIERFDKVAYDKNKAEDKPVGFIIAFSFGKGAVQEVARLKNTENITIELVTVNKIVPIAQKPTLEIITTEIMHKSPDLPKDGLWEGMCEIEFEARGKSENEIEFYAWDFNYNEQVFIPEILFDKEGKQVRKFKAGTHKIAAKVIDKEGLETVETIKLKINGKTEIIK